MIVTVKLLTGFDAPIEQVIYLGGLSISLPPSG